MLVTLCIGQVREVRGFEQIRYSALLRSTARLSVMSVLVLKIEKTHLNLYFTGAFLAAPSNSVLKLVAIASILAAVTLIYVNWRKSGDRLDRRAHSRSVFYSLLLRGSRCSI